MSLVSPSRANYQLVLMIGEEKNTAHKPDHCYQCHPQSGRLFFFYTFFSTTRALRHNKRHIEIYIQKGSCANRPLNIDTTPAHRSPPFDGFVYPS